MRYIISKNFFSLIPPILAASIRAVQDRHPSIKSLTIQFENPGFKLHMAEGSEFTAVFYSPDEKRTVVRSVQMAAEHTGGATGDVRIGAEVPLPPGCVVLETYYYSRYFLTVHVVPADLALPASEILKPMLPAPSKKAKP